MKKFLLPILGLAILLLVLMACGNETEVQPESEDAMSESTVPPSNPEESSSSLVQFPENYEEGELYTTVTRGSTFEELYTSREAIEAVQNGEPVPSGTVVTLKISKDDEIDRIFVMEKRADWDPELLPEQRNGEWAYQSFTSDGAVDEQEDIGSCISCHAGQENDDFLHKLDEMKTYDLEALANEDSLTAAHFTDSQTEGWDVLEVNTESGMQVAAGKEKPLQDEATKEMVQNVLFQLHISGLES